MGMIATVDRQAPNSAKNILPLILRRSFDESVKLLYHGIHLPAVEESVAVGIDIPQHRKARIIYWENPVQDGAIP
jgi:hypothetical protein